MQKILRASALAWLIVGLSGCSILSPGKKELFQTKVPTFPEKAKVEEKQKQAATFVAEKVGIAYDEGLKANVTNSVMSPLYEAKVVAAPLAESLGSPQTPYRGTATNLVDELHKLDAKFDAAMRKLEGKLGELEGKKIEGTGLIQMGYFTWLFVLFGIFALLWFVLKIVSIFNPPVAMGMSAVSAGSNLLRRGFNEVIEAGENFKNAVKAKVEDPDTQERVLEMFRQAQLAAQSRDVQLVVKQLTNNPNDPVKLAKELSS